MSPMLTIFSWSMKEMEGFCWQEIGFGEKESDIRMTNDTVIFEEAILVDRFNRGFFYAWNGMSYLLAYDWNVCLDDCFKMMLLMVVAE